MAVLMHKGTIADLCNIEYGTRVVNKRDGGSVYPVYGGGGATFKMDTYNRESRMVIARFAMSEGCTRFIEGRFYLNDSGLTLSPKNDDLSEPYLNYQILSLNDDIYSLARGAAQKNLNVDAFKKLEISVVPLAEQKRIVAILDEVFADIEQTRAKTEQNLKNARELFESYLQQVFSQRGEGWSEYELGDVCTFKHGFAFKSEYFCYDSDYLLLTPGNFFEEGGYRDRGTKQKFYDGPFPEDFLLSKGDLLVAMTEQAAGLLGSPALIPEDGIFLHNQRLGLVELTADFLGRVKAEFLFHFFNTHYFRSQVQETASGVKVRHTSPKKMQAISVWLPIDLNEQELIANRLFQIKEQVVELEEKYSEKLTALDELKKSILQKAFSGELTQGASKEEVA